MKDQNSGSDIILFESTDGEAKLEVTTDYDTVWLTKPQMAELFGRDRTVITRHINNIYKEEELDQDLTCAKFAQVQIEGGRHVQREIEHFNLDVIISVGYRVKSKRGVEFRQWATKILKQYLIVKTGSGISTMGHKNPKAISHCQNGEWNFDNGPQKS